MRLILFLFLIFLFLFLFFLFLFCCMSIGFRLLIVFLGLFVLLFLFLLFFFDGGVRWWIWFPSASFTLPSDIFCRFPIRFWIRCYFCNYIVRYRLAFYTIICIALFPIWRSAFIWFAVFIQLDENKFSPDYIWFK